MHYLLIHKRVPYTTLPMGDTIKDCLEEVNKSADEMYEQLTLQKKAHESDPRADQRWI